MLTFCYKAACLCLVVFCEAHTLKQNFVTVPTAITHKKAFITNEPEMKASEAAQLGKELAAKCDDLR